jgi:hypothetical protein
MTLALPRTVHLGHTTGHDLEDCATCPPTRKGMTPMNNAIRRRYVERAGVTIGVVWACIALAMVLMGSIKTSSAMSTETAVSARIISLTESGTLRVTKSQGSIIEAHGPVSGTLSGLLSLHTVVNSASHMTTSFVGSSRTGTLNGTTGLDYGVSGNRLYYTGTASITRGTGVYTHAHATGIHVEGTMDRKLRIVTIHISGKLSL